VPSSLQLLQQQGPWPWLLLLPLLPPPLQLLLLLPHRRLVWLA